MPEALNTPCPAPIANALLTDTPTLKRRSIARRPRNPPRRMTLWPSLHTPRQAARMPKERASPKAWIDEGHPLPFQFRLAERVERQGLGASRKRLVRSEVEQVRRTGDQEPSRPLVTIDRSLEA